MIGKRVRVFWPVDQQWYMGIVQQYNQTTGEHQLSYPDGDTEWVKIGENDANQPPQPQPPQERQQEGAQGQQRPPPSGAVSASDGAGGAGAAPIGTVRSEHSARTAAEMESAAAVAASALLSAAASADSATANGGAPSTATATAPGGTVPVVVHPPPSHPGQPAGPGGAVPVPPPGPVPGGVVPGPSAWAVGQPHAAAAVGGMPLPPAGYQYPYHPSYPGYAHLAAAYGPPGAPPPPGVPVATVPGAPPPPSGAPPPAPPAVPGKPTARGHPTVVPPHHYARVPGTAPGYLPLQPQPTEHVGKRKAGPKSWSKEEDTILLNLVKQMRMPMKWSVVAQSLPGRTGKQCRERYVNHLNPRLKSSEWTPVEDATIFRLYDTTGSQWAKMAKMIPGRTDNGIKNRFHNLRRQLEREDEQRLRLSKPEDYPGEIYLSKINKDIPRHLLGKSADLWASTTPGTMAVIAALSVLGGTGHRSMNAPKFGPFRPPAEGGEQCTRCGLFAPSAQTGDDICSQTRWCRACTRVPPHLGGDLLRECLKLRKCQDSEKLKVIDSMK